jgi:hypothetical protein
MFRNETNIISWGIFLNQTLSDPVNTVVIEHVYTVVREFVYTVVREPV